MDRINQYKTERRTEELFEKEQKIENFKKKKKELIENKANILSSPFIVVPTSSWFFINKSAKSPT